MPLFIIGCTLIGISCFTQIVRSILDGTFFLLHV